MDSTALYALSLRSFEIEEAVTTASHRERIEHADLDSCGGNVVL